MQLPEPRIQNFVICNDSQEFYINSDPLPMPWHNNNEAASQNLLYALSSNQLVLSTKSLWYNVQYIAQLWHDFANLSIEEIKIKYQEFSKFSSAEFEKNCKIYQPCIQQIHKLYNEINNVIAAHSNQPLPQISAQINLAMKSAWNEKPKWLQDEQLEAMIIPIFTTFTLYQLIIKNNYICKDVSNDFILFIPQGLKAPSSYSDQLRTITTQANITLDDIFTGLHYSQAKNFNLSTQLTLDQAKKLAPNLISSKRIGNLIFTRFKDLGLELYTTLNSILIKKNSLRAEFQDHYAEVLPFFNIFMAGHGSLDSIAANIDITITTRTKIVTTKSKLGVSESKKITYESSDFLDILRLLNDEACMKSLTILSCYPGGKKIQEEFNISSKLNNYYLENINYPIMLLGSTFAPVTSAFWLTSLPPFQNTDVSNFIYLKQKLYGPIKIDGQESFTRFFNFLNSDATYEKFQTTTKNKSVQHYRLQDVNKKLPAIETFSHAKPSYLYAANVFAYIYNGNTMNSENFANYVLIKFPHTSWFTPARFKNLMIKLSQITTLTKDIMIIPQSTQAILMDANNIPTEIILERSEKISFIPINYLNQNYVFNNITIMQDIRLNQFVKQFFTIETIAEPINILIKKLTLGTEQYTNVYIFIHNDFGINDARNGYIATNPTHETLMVSWDNSKTFEFDKKTEKYSVENLTKLISTITKNASKQFDSITQTGKTYDIETSGTISQKNIQKLEDSIASQQSNNLAKAKIMHKESIKQYKKEEQRLHIMDAFDLAVTLRI